MAIQFLHQSETVQKIKSNKLKIAQHKAQTTEDKKPIVKGKGKSKDKSKEKSKTDKAGGEPSSCSSPGMSLSALKEKNLELADELDFTRVTIKNKVSLRTLSRKNYVIDAMKERPVFEGSVDLYKVSTNVQGVTSYTSKLL